MKSLSGTAATRLPPVVDARVQPGNVGPRLHNVIDAYQTDPLSSFHKQRFHVRQNHAGMLRRVRDQHGATPIGDITGRTLIEWHAGWMGADKVAMAHSMIGQLRTVFSFGLPESLPSFSRVTGLYSI